MNVNLLTVILAAAFFQCAQAQGDELSLIFKNRHSLAKWDMKTQEYTDIVTTLKSPTAIDYHYEKGLVFWTDNKDKKIYSFDLGSNGPITAIVDFCDYPMGVAVDWIHDNLYWTDFTRQEIGVARLNGSFVKTPIVKNLQRPHVIVLDPLEGWIFWMDAAYNTQIERSRMDGTHQSVIVKNEIRKAYTLTIDRISHAIYWIYDAAREISTCRYDGTNVRVIVSSAEAVSFKGIDVLGDWLYVSVRSSPKNSIYKVDKHGVGNMTLIIEGRNWIDLNRFKVYDSSMQIPGVNRCVNNGGCPYLCLPAPPGLVKGEPKHTCVYPDNVSFNVDPSTNVTLPGKSKNGQYLTHNSFLPEMIIGFLIGLVILAYIIFYLFKQFSTRPKHKVMQPVDGKRTSFPLKINL